MLLYIHPAAGRASSITKRMVIKDEKNCIALAKALKASTWMLEINPDFFTPGNFYEEGREKLRQYLLNFQK